MKKAQSISINTIVVAAIAIVVMVLIMMIFASNMSRFRRSVNACESNSGFCVDSDDVAEKCSGNKFVNKEYVCYKFNNEPDPNRVCCLST